MWGVVKGLLMRAIFIYMITSFFRRPSAPATRGDGNPGVVLPTSSKIYSNGTLFDLYLYVSEDQLKPNFNNPAQLVWFKPDLTYGDWKSGPTGDGQYVSEVTVPLSQVYYFIKMFFILIKIYTFVACSKQWFNLDAFVFCSHTRQSKSGLKRLQSHLYDSSIETVEQI